MKILHYKFTIHISDHLLQYESSSVACRKSKSEYGLKYNFVHIMIFVIYSDTEDEETIRSHFITKGVFFLLHSL